MLWSGLARSSGVLVFGGDDPGVYEKAKNDGTLNTLPSNHSPRFAPVIHPTLETGVKALVVAAHAWLTS